MRRLFKAPAWNVVTNPMLIINLAIWTSVALAFAKAF